MKNQTCLVLLAFMLFFLHGCVAVQSFPTAARSGDTVSLAVGSAEGMTKANTVLIYTPDPTPEIPIPISTIIPASNLRAIIPIYPEKRANVWLNSGAAGIPEASGHAGWLTVLVVDLPSLPVGHGVMRVQTAATYPQNTASVNTQDISLEIVAGQGASSTFKYISGLSSNGVKQYRDGNLALLERMPHYQFKPDIEPLFSYQWPTYGAVEIIITGQIIPFTATDLQIDSSMSLFHDEMKENLKSQFTMNWNRNGNDTIVRIISPTGQLKYHELNLSIVFATNNLSYLSVPTISWRYFDINGEEVPGPIIKATYQAN